MDRIFFSISSSHRLTGLDSACFCKHQSLQSLTLHIGKSLPKPRMKKKIKARRLGKYSSYFKKIKCFLALTKNCHPISIKKKKKGKWLKNKTDCVSQAVTTGAYPGFEGWFSHCPMSQKAFLPYLLQVPNKKRVCNGIFHCY